MRKLLVFLAVITISLGAMSQGRVEIGWPASLSSTIFSNCLGDGVTVKVKVYNNTDTVLTNYRVDGFFNNGWRYVDGSVPVPPGDSTELILVNNESQDPGPHYLSAVFHGRTDSIRTTIDVLYCRNVGIDAILYPEYPSTVDFIEGESITLRARFTNFGAQVSSTAYWTLTNIEGTEYLPAKAVPPMAHGESVEDTWEFTPPSGYIGLHKVKISLNPPDQYVGDNYDSVYIYLHPAYDVQAVDADAPSGQCNMRQAPITMKLVNQGKKPILAGDSILVGYAAELTTSGVTVPTLPIRHEEYYHFTADFQPGDTLPISFAQRANIYPTGLNSDISVRMYGWCHFELNSVKTDIVLNNDTTSSMVITSLHVPIAPIVSDLHIPYATRTTLRASHPESLPIRWYTDTLQEPFINSSTYETTTHWASPQYFRDTDYYVQVTAPNGCVSPIATARVILNARVPIDASVKSVVLPQQEMVYTEDDTVRIEICNYGTDTLVNFPVFFEVHRLDGTDSHFLQRSSSVVNQRIAPDHCDPFTFDVLVTIHPDFRNLDYRYAFNTWTAHPADLVPQNDTLFDPYTFRTLPEDAYCTPTVTNPKSMDIVSVHFNSLANEISPVGFSSINFGRYDTTQRIVPALHLVHGQMDSLIVQIANASNSADDTTMCTFLLCIDYNRDGDFGDFGEVISSTTVPSLGRVGVPVSISPTSHYGYMRMRIMIMEGVGIPMTSCMTIPRGTVQDYLLYIEPEAPSIDAALTYFVVPNTPIMSNPSERVRLMIANRGTTPIEYPSLHYHFTCADSSASESGIYRWVGIVPPLHSVEVMLPSYIFPEGTTNIDVTLHVDGDEDRSNDSLHYQVHRFRSIRALTTDTYENPARRDYWYAPEGNYPYNRNLWELGYPYSTTIQGAYSGANAWATDLDNEVIAGPEGNRSVLYSPMIDIRISRPDSLSFYINQNFGSGSRLIVEYLDAYGHWRTLRAISSTEWYTDLQGFHNTNSNGYQRQRVTMGLSHIAATLGNTSTQFRLIYYADINATPKNYNDGCAVDNFRLGHLRGRIDVGVTGITAETAPQRRRPIYPWIIITNIGYDTVSNIPVEYLVWGATEPVVEVFTGKIAPGASDTLFFQTPFTCGLNFPEEFPICANTALRSDIYNENDSMCTTFNIAPTDDDLELRAYLSPRPLEVAADSVEITIRMCNNGSYPIDRVTLEFDYNDQYHVTQPVDFIGLMGGRGLEGHKCFNYTLPQRYHVSIGYTTLYAQSTIPYDVRETNDTLEMLFSGLTFARDLQAEEIVVDASDSNGVRILFSFFNSSAQMLDECDVSFYIDGDISTIYTQHLSGLSLNALERCYVTFAHTLPNRAMGYTDVTCIVHNDDDIDFSNDTTTLIVQPYIDVAVKQIIIQENEDPECRVRVRIQNRGNFPLRGPYKVVAVINGKTITMLCNETIEPGETRDVEFDSTLTKSENSHYEGSASVQLPDDMIQEDNQTSSLKVVSRFGPVAIEQVLVADGGILVVRQNLPNPATVSTVIPFAITKPSAVTLMLIDGNGRLLHTARGYYAQGQHQFTLSTSHLATGIYYYVVQAGTSRVVKKMIVE